MLTFFYSFSVVKCSHYQSKSDSLMTFGDALKTRFNWYYIDTKVKIKNNLTGFSLTFRQCTFLLPHS